MMMKESNSYQDVKRTKNYKILIGTLLQKPKTFLLLYKRNKIHKILFYFLILMVLNLSFGPERRINLEVT